MKGRNLWSLIFPPAASLAWIKPAAAARELQRRYGARWMETAIRRFGTNVNPVARVGL